MLYHKNYIDPDCFAWRHDSVLKLLPLQMLLRLVITKIFHKKDYFNQLLKLSYFCHDTTFLLFFIHFHNLNVKTRSHCSLLNHMSSFARFILASEFSRVSYQGIFSTDAVDVHITRQCHKCAYT